MNKTIAYMLFTIAWVIIAGNFMEVGENMRFRFLVDPFIWILITVFVWRVVKKLIQKPRFPSPKPFKFPDYYIKSQAKQREDEKAFMGMFKSQRGKK